VQVSIPHVPECSGMNDQLRTDLQKINDRLQTLQVRL